MTAPQLVRWLGYSERQTRDVLERLTDVHLVATAGKGLNGGRQYEALPRLLLILKAHGIKASTFQQLR